MDPRAVTADKAGKVQRGSARTVVAAVDESPFAELVLEHVKANFNDAGTRVVFVHVVKPADALKGKDDPEAKKYVVDGMVKRTEDAKLACGAEGHVLIGDAREEIERFCRLIRPDTLVIGSHGEGAVKRAMLGSVSHYCVQHCGCPVLVVRSPDTTKHEEASKGFHFPKISSLFKGTKAHRESKPPQAQAA